MGINHETLIQALKSLSVRDFLNLGVKDVAYIRPISIDNRQAYAIHAADGTPLSVLDSLDNAIIVVRDNDLEPVTVH